MPKLALQVFLVCAAPAAAAATGNTFGDILRGMATGLAILGRSTNAGNSNLFSPFSPYALPPGYAWPSPTFPGWGGNGWSTPYGYPAYGPGYGRPYRGRPYAAPYSSDNDGYAPLRYQQTPTLDKLQGSWEVLNDEGLLLVKANMARLYASRDEYQDFYIQADKRYLWMWPVGSKVPQRYRLRIQSDRIVLDDELGYTLTLRRYQPGSWEDTR
jgi:hypothetical protein